MKLVKTAGKRGKFELLASTGEVQAMMMTLKPGGVTDEEPSNEHRHSEQWLYVLAGTGEARTGKRRGQLRKLKLAAGSLLVIEKGELHQIRNTGKRSMKTINFYAPPAYDENGEPIGTLRTYLRALGG